VSPTASAIGRHRPVEGPGARLTGALLHDWQRRNRRSSLPLAMRQMDAAGNLGNLRLAITGASEGYRGNSAAARRSPWPASRPRRSRCWRRPSKPTAT
jgi:hypothetical protein